MRLCIKAIHKNQLQSRLLILQVTKIEETLRGNKAPSLVLTKIYLRGTIRNPLKKIRHIKSMEINVDLYIRQHLLVDRE